MAQKKRQTNPKRIAKTARRKAAKASKRQAASRRRKNRTRSDRQIVKAFAILQAKLKLSAESGSPPEIPPDETDEFVATDVAIGSYLRNCDPKALRQFYGGATKFLLQRENWDDAPPVSRVDHHPKVKSIRGGFTIWRQADLPIASTNPDHELLEAMRRAAGRNPGKRLAVREAREALTKLLRNMRGWCRRYITSESRPEGGLAAFYLTLKRTYYPKGPANSGTDLAMSQAEWEL
jgi:hypothetical protein